MSKRTETVELTEAELREAVGLYLRGKYSGAVEDWSIVLKHEVLSEGFGLMERDTTHYSAVAVRPIK